jgi:hypothetical protein
LKTKYYKLSNRSGRKKRYEMDKLGQLIGRLERLEDAIKHGLTTISEESRIQKFAEAGLELMDEVIDSDDLAERVEKTNA